MNEKKPPQVRVVFEGDMQRRFEAIKDHYGMKKNADLVRLLITLKYEDLGLGPELPRFEQINSDNDGVKIHDRELHRVVDVFFKPQGIKCGYDQTDDCVHVDFALSLPGVKELVRKRRKEGWKLPDA